MGISVIGGGGAASAKEPTYYYYIDTLNNNLIVNLKSLGLGNNFTIKMYGGRGIFRSPLNDITSYPTTFELLDNNLNILDNVNNRWVDADSGNTRNPVQCLVDLNTAPSYIKIYTTFAFTIELQKFTDTFGAHIPTTFTKVSTSGNVTFPGTRNFLIIGGGGGGGGSNSGGAGGGGGSGYITFGQLPAGTYSLTVGAGGIGVNNGNGTNGGTTTFNGTFTAAGGTGGQGVGQGAQGGAGGSGGAGGRTGSSSVTRNGGANGSNGENGVNGSSGALIPAGVGSGVQVSSPFTPLSVGGTSNPAGFYGGGNSSPRTNGGDIGAGGGGVHNWNTADIGGNGASGGLVYWDESGLA